LKIEDISTVLNEVMIDIIHVTVKTSIEKNEAMTMAFTQYCESKNWNIKDLNLKIVTDSIGQYVLNLGTKTDIENGEVFVWGCLYANCGASIQNEQAFAIAHGHEYLQAQIENGIPPEKAAANITFQLALGNSYFTEMAKIRAFRTLWNSVLANYGVENHYTTVHVENSNFYQSNLDLHNNLLRGTTAAMAGILGGADSLEVLKYDMNIEEKRSDAARMSKNISLILQEEAYFNQVKDATNGSYYIEQLTDIIIEKSWTKFQEIEKMGGFLVAFEKGTVAKWIKEDLAKKQAQFKNEELILLGTNKHPNAKETRSENYQPINTDEKFLAPYRVAQTKLN
jgi:methylmalonyl-CoA mutase